MNFATKIELNIPFQAEFLPVAAGCVEQSLQVYGFGRAEAMRLTLAVEEVFAFLSAQAPAGQQLKLECRNGGYYAEVICHFPGQGLPVRAFNITATVSSDDERSLSEMGLLLAARAVDRLEVKSEKGCIRLHFVKEKDYPASSESEGRVAVSGTLREVEPSVEAMKQFAQRVAAVYGAKAPAFFAFPGKVADMVASGEYGATLLADDKGRIGAGVFWRTGGKMAEVFGPYVFCEETTAAAMAVEACLKKMARTALVCLVVQDPTPQMPPGYFEQLAQAGQVMYRQLEEDNGAQAYIHPELANFLRESFRQLCLAREIHQVEHQGEQQSPHAAFAVQMDKPAGRVTLACLWPGLDAPQVLQEHVRVLRQEGFGDIKFRLDTGEAEQALLGPALKAAGFLPAWILPWGGRGDIMVLAHQEAAWQ